MIAVIVLLSMCSGLLLVLVGLIGLIFLRLKADSGQAYLDAIYSQRTPVFKRAPKAESRGRKVEESRFQRLEDMDQEAVLEALTEYSESSSGAN